MNNKPSIKNIKCNTKHTLVEPPFTKLEIAFMFIPIITIFSTLVIAVCIVIIAGTK